MRTKNLISYPKYNRKDGDLSQNWYVEFQFRLPDDETPHRYRVYSGLGKGTADERDDVAEKLIAYYTNYLKSGEYLKSEPNLNPLKHSETFRPEHKMWTDRYNEMRIDSLVLKFLNHIQKSVKPKTFQDYTSKLKVFKEYVVNELNNLPINKVTHSQLMPFFESLANDKDLCRQTIEKYMQIVRTFFTWCEDIGMRDEETNPIKRVPKIGRVIDKSPGVFDRDERVRLKNAIKPNEPWLWLACEIIYYCAIRPGSELRLLRVGDINFDTNTIRVRAEIAKNKTTEIVGIPNVLMSYMYELNLNMYDKELYIFGKNGVPSNIEMGKNTMRNRFNRYRDMLRISPDKKFYSWKHTGAISAAQNGATIFELKDQLRHKSIQTTEEYLKKRQPKKAAAADKMDML